VADSTDHQGLVLLFDLSLTVETGEVVCLLGRNGAGKTTTVRSIVGLTPPRSGRITLRGRDLAGLAPFRIARLGIGFVPYILEKGMVRYQGSMAEFVADAEARQAYLAV
jgi:ABC-type branched-subunit amino acid transport system ATPase component